MHLASVRRLLRALRVAAPDKRAVANMAELTITANWRLLAWVAMGAASEDAKIVLNPVALVAFGVPRAAGEAGMQAIGGRGSAGVA